MPRVLVTTTRVVLLAVFPMLAGCGSADSSGDIASTTTVREAAPKPVPRAPARPNTKRIDARDVLNGLASAGLETKDLGPARISMDDLSRFPEEPRATLYLRVSDGQGNSSPMTFVEFGSWKTAAKVDAKPINGFAVRNWFVVGIVSNYFVDRVTEALEG